MPDTVIGRALTSGSNERHSIEHIVAFFQKQSTGSAAATFMEKEFKEGGKGVNIAGQDYALWFSREGFRIAPGRSAFGPGSTLVPWVKAAALVSNLLRDGMYATQDRIDAAPDNEIRELSEKLWHLRQDFSDSAREQNFLPTISQHFFGKGFPDDTKEIAELLKAPVHRQQIMREMAVFADEHKKSPDLLRFKHHPAPWELFEQVNDLFAYREQFHAMEGFAPVTGKFVTEDEIDHMIAGGPHVSESKLQIYSYFVQGHNAKECAEYLKDSYGTGGYGYMGYNEHYDTKGIRLSRGDDFSKGDYDTATLNWNQVQKRIRTLIDSGQYLNEQEKLYLPRYEKLQLARKIYAFQYYNPNALNRTYPHEWDFEAPERDILPLLNDPEKSAALYEDMVKTLAAVPLDDRAYTKMEPALQDMGAFIHGEYSLFAPLPEAVLQAERQQKQTAKEKKKEQTHTNQRATRTISEAPEVPDGELSAAARALAQKMQPNVRESEDGQLSFDLFGGSPQSAEPLPEPPRPTSPPKIPVVVETILSPELAAERRQQIAAEEKEAATRYDLGYGHQGNGLTVWNRLEEEHGDYKTVAHIAPDRAVTFYDQDMPEVVKAQIRKTAMTAEMSISATQDAPVFSVPPQVPEQSREVVTEEKTDMTGAGVLGDTEVPENVQQDSNANTQKGDKSGPTTTQEHTPTVQELYEHYKPIVKSLVLEDDAYKNACINSDREAATFEGNEAVKRAALSLIDVTRFFRLYSDNTAFHTRLHREIVEETYPILSRFWQEHENGQDSDAVLHGPEFMYRRLSILKSDCDYYLGAGQRYQKHLSEGGIEAQIAKMRELYDALPEKPEWLTVEDIDRYEAQMHTSVVTVTVPNYEATVTAEEAPLLARLLANSMIDTSQFVHDNGAVTFMFGQSDRDAVEKLITQLRMDISKAVASTYKTDTPKKPGRTRPELNYRTFARMFPEIISGEYRYLSMEAGESMMPLHLEWIDTDVIAVSHTYTLNGDLMYDPEMTFQVDREKETLEPLSFRQDGSLPIHQEVYPEPGRWIPKLSRDLSNFAQQWLKNISQQNYHKKEAIVERDGEDVHIQFSPDGTVTTPQSKQAEQAPEFADPVRLYREALAAINQLVRASSLYSYFQSRDTDYDEAKDLLDNEIASHMEEVGPDNPDLFNAYTSLPMFREWLVEDILERNYQDYSLDPRDAIERNMGSEDAPDWIRSSATEPVSVMEHALKGPGTGDGDPFVDVDAAEYIPLNMELTIDGQRMMVDSVDYNVGVVLLQALDSEERDPVYRSGTVAFIRKYVEEAQRTMEQNMNGVDNSEPAQVEDGTEIPSAPETVPGPTEAGAPEQPEHADAAPAEPDLTPNVEQYLNLKAQYPDRLIGVQVGGYMLFYGKDAEEAASALGTNLVTREIDGLGETAVTGKPAAWQAILKHLREHGNSVLLARPDPERGPDAPYEIIQNVDSADYIPLGMELTIDGRRMMIDSVDYDAGTVSLRDMDLKGWLPIFRSEPVSFVREFVEEVQSTEEYIAAEMEVQRKSVEPQAADAPKEPEVSEPASKPLAEPEQVEIDGGQITAPLEVREKTVKLIRDERIPFEIEIRTMSFGPEQHNFHITDDNLGVGGDKTKFQYNMAAIRTLKQIEAESRLATPEEQEILSRYVGWGGLAQAFDPNNEKWAKEYAELYDLLTPEEYAAARTTTVNAHYTSPTVIKAIYQAVENMDYQPGTVLDITTLDLIQRRRSEKAGNPL